MFSPSTLFLSLISKNFLLASSLFKLILDRYWLDCNPNYWWDCGHLVLFEKSAIGDLRRIRYATFSCASQSSRKLFELIFGDSKVLHLRFFQSRFYRRIRILLRPISAYFKSSNVEIVRGAGKPISCRFIPNFFFIGSKFSRGKLQSVKPLSSVCNLVDALVGFRHKSIMLSAASPLLESDVLFSYEVIQV